MLWSSLRKTLGSRRKAGCVSLWTGVLLFGLLSLVGVLVHTYEAIHCDWKVVDGVQAKAQGYFAIQMHCRVVGGVLTGHPIAYRKMIPPVPVRVYPRNKAGDSVYRFNLLAVLSSVEMWFVLTAAALGLWSLVACTRNLPALFTLPLIVVGEWAVRLVCTIMFFVFFRLSAWLGVFVALLVVADTAFRFMFADIALSLYRAVAAGGSGRERLSVNALQQQNYKEIRQRGHASSTLEPSGNYRPSRSTLARFPHTGTAKSSRLLTVDHQVCTARHRPPSLSMRGGSIAEADDTEHCVSVVLENESPPNNTERNNSDGRYGACNSLL